MTMDDPEVPEPVFRYQVLDLMAFVTSIACFCAAVRAIGWVAVALLPALLIAPSVLATPENSREVKIAFVFVMLLLTAILYFRI